MNTHSSKEYWYIFTMTWKQASTSHLSSRLTDNASGKLLIIFILSYLFMLPTSFLRIHKTHNRTSLQVWHAKVLYFCFFCKPTFSRATREWDTLYYICTKLKIYMSVIGTELCFHKSEVAVMNIFTHKWSSLFQNFFHLRCLRLHLLVLQSLEMTQVSNALPL
jgi:hypothetical protein